MPEEKKDKYKEARNSRPNPMSPKGATTGSNTKARREPGTLADSQLNPSSQKGYLEDSMDKFAEEMHPAIAQANAVQETKNVMDEALKIAGGDNKLGSPKLTNMTDAIHAANQAVMQDWIKVLDSPEMKKSRVMGDLGGIIGAVGGAFGMPGLMIGGNKLAGMAKTTQDQFLLPLAKQMDTAVQGAMSAYQPDGLMQRAGSTLAVEWLKNAEERKRSLNVDPTQKQLDAVLNVPSVKAANMEDYLRSGFQSILDTPQEDKAAAIGRHLTTANKSAMVEVDAAVRKISTDTSAMNEIAALTENQDYKGARNKAWEYVEKNSLKMLEAPPDYLEEQVDKLVKYTADGEPIMSAKSPGGGVTSESLSNLTGVSSGTAYLGSMLGIENPKDLALTGQISDLEVKDVPLLSKMDVRVASRAVLINEFRRVLKKESIKSNVEDGTIIKIPTRYEEFGKVPGQWFGTGKWGSLGLDKKAGLITVFASPLNKNALPDQIDEAWEEAWVDTNKFSAGFRAYLRGVAPKLRT